MSILVLGDLIIDEYVNGSCSRISPESPVPVITNLKTEKKLGGAANVAFNIKAMGSEVKLVSQAGKDLDPSLIKNLQAEILPSNSTPTKTRILANNHAICRLDTEEYQRVTPDKKWFIPEPSICVLSDYNKGFLHDSNQIIKWCKSAGIRSIVDPKKPWHNYHGCWVLKANYKELQDQVGHKVELLELSNVCGVLAKNLDIENLVITLGSQGLFVWTQTANALLPTKFNRVVDVTGAGDVVIAALAHFSANGYSLIESAKRANSLAESSVAHHGCYVVTENDLSQAEEKIVFTNGCFDIVHRGHVEYLRKSKSYGTKLIVGLNSDASVKLLKGPGRPVHNQCDRKAVLESFEFVDEVIIFDELTPSKLIEQIKPDIITKGGDYTVDKVVGNDIVKQVIIIPTVENHSTTSIIRKLEKR